LRSQTAAQQCFCFIVINIEQEHVHPPPLHILRVCAHSGACAHSAAGHDTDAELRQLENTCYAAKQCGVERCAGTLVNMRKSLCNLGKVLTSELNSAFSSASTMETNNRKNIVCCRIDTYAPGAF
jgi:hypothetical protein